MLRDRKMFAFYRPNAPAAGAGVPEPRLTNIVASVSEDGARPGRTPMSPPSAMPASPISMFDPVRKMFFLVWHDNRNKDLDIFFSKKISLVPGGRFDVAWCDFRNDSFPAPTVAPMAPYLGLTTDVGKFDAVYTRYSADAGETRSKNLRVSDVPNDRTLGTAGPQFFLQVRLAVASGKDWSVVAWSDTRNGNLDNSTQDIASSVVDHAFTTTGRLPRQ